MIKKARVNQEITASRVRLIDSTGAQAGIVSIDEALLRAQDANLDLVEVSPQSDPPVCRVMDYGRHRFQHGKPRGKKKNKTRRQQLKEIKFRPNTGLSDYNVKLRKIMQFLEGGDKVKASVQFRGREMAFQNLGFSLLSQLEADIEQSGKIEQPPSLESRHLFMIIIPKKK